jgi:hypothetical protein
MAAWLGKWGPLAGVVSALLFAGGIVQGSNAPDSNESGQQVIAWYTAHHTSQTVSNLLGALAMFFLVVFAAVLARHVRQGERWIAAGALAGAGCAAIGLTATLGFNFILATDTAKLTPGSAQTLMLLSNDFFLPAAVGLGLFGVLGGLAVVAGRILPAAMGWVLLVLGVAVLIPGLSWFALLATMIWVLIAGVWLTRQGLPALDRELAPAAQQVPSLT